MQKNPIFEEILLNQKNADISHIVADICLYLEDKKPFSFNPVLINGKTETGKSHIMACFAKFYPQKVQCLQCGDIMFHQKDDLKKLFTVKSGKKLFIFDDIQRLQEDLGLQEQVIYFAEKLMAHMLVVFLRNTENEQPMPRNFESKINQGLTFTLHEPDLDIKTRYTMKLCQNADIKISKEQCLFIARRSSGFRNIQTIVNHILLYREHMQKMPALQDIERIVAKKGQVFTLNPEIIIATVAQHYGFSVKDIKGKKRYPRIAEARHLSIYLCRMLLGETYAEIGKIFGGKDHSTIVHSIKKIEDLRVTNKVMNNLITEVTMKCKKGLSAAKQA